MAVDPPGVFVADAHRWPPQAWSLGSARILVVDDDAQAARLLLRILQRFGFERVESVGDARRALGVMKDHPPDVVLLDVHMPYLDGFEVLREMQSVRRQGVVPGIVAISGDGAIDTRRAMFAGGADDFVVRPCDATELGLRVARLAASIRAQRDLTAHVAALERQVARLARDQEPHVLTPPRPDAVEPTTTNPAAPGG